MNILMIIALVAFTASLALLGLLIETKNDSKARAIFVYMVLCWAIALSAACV
jgi:hypothetical protein